MRQHLVNARTGSVICCSLHTLAVLIGIHVIYDAVMFLTWYVQEKHLAVQAAQSQAVGQGA